MKNYIKLYLFFLIPSCLILAAITFIDYKDQVRKTTKDFNTKYEVQTQLYADQIKEVEKLYEIVMRNATIAAQNKILGTNISTKKLQEIANELSITHLFLIDKNGHFTHSTNEDPSKIPNLFSFSPEYKKLISNKELKYFTTPIILPFPEREPHKFLTIWTGSFFIEVGMRIKDIANNVTKLLERDKNIEKIEFDLGGIAYTVSPLVSTLSKSHFETIKKIKTSNSSYIQADNKLDHQYKLRFFVSDVNLLNSIKKIQTKVVQQFITFLSTIILILFTLTFFIKRRISRITRALLKFANNTDTEKNLEQFSTTDDIQNLTNAINKVLSSYRQNNKRESQKAIEKIYAEVAHDIRSPLAALKISQEYISNEADRSIISKSIERIDTLSKSLDPTFNQSTSSIKLSAVIAQIIAEKKHEYKSYPKLHIRSVGENNSLVLIDSCSLERVLSNLINNSAEAMNFEGEIIISSLSINENFLSLKIKDQGSGFPDSILKDNIITSSKNAGNGIGLSSSIEIIKNFGGEIKIYNANGANVEILLKKKNIQKPSNMILIDNDKLICDSWATKASNESISLFTFNSVDEFLAKASLFDFKIPIYVDSDLGNGLKGEVLSKKIFDIGFKEIYLATGMNASLIQRPEWINGVIGKGFPL
jgi:C4-dicarboxylate-specific signal transduction histidine kinase